MKGRSAQWGRAALVSAYADLAVFPSCEAMLLSPPLGTIK